MRPRRLLLGALVPLVLLAAAPAHATMIGATVDISAQNGFSSGASICKTASVVGEIVVGGGELTGADWTGGCVGYYGADITANTITLTPIESGNYQYADFNLQIQSGATITGVSFLGYTDNFFQVGGALNDSNFLPSIVFDASSLTIVWDGGNLQFVFNGPLNGGQSPIGTAVFQVLTADQVPVPEPASLTLLGLGLASMRARRWRQRKRA